MNDKTDKRRLSIYQDAGTRQCRNGFELLDTMHTGRSEFHAPYDAAPHAPQPGGARVTAFYLPQFHTIDLNDQAWGRGFTEWTNVTKTQPYFAGHVQPLLPADLGFYDLNNVEVIEKQISLAKHYGVTGFCFHYYWFEGKRILTKPLDNFLGLDERSFEFSICWANDTWSKKWDGSESEIIIQQRHSFEIDKYFIFDILPLLERENYTRVNGRPLLVLYRPNLLGADLDRTIDFWRNQAVKRHLGDPLILSSPCLLTSQAMQSTPQALDGYVQFPPHEFWHQSYRVRPGQSSFLLNQKFEGGILDASAAREYFTKADYGDSLVFRCAFPGWDNTARKREKSSIFCNSTPANFQQWMVSNLQHALADSRFDNLVFVNAWNEWAEGAVLEPSRWYGHAYLDALKKSLQACGT
jgi:lipopolysaccharide biosynthesis protein